MPRVPSRPGLAAAAPLLLTLAACAPSSPAGNVKGTAWLAAEAGRLGLTPAGDDGTFFQTVPLVRRTLPADAVVTAGGVTARPPAPWPARR